jgi:hypothetical protein
MAARKIRSKKHAQKRKKAQLNKLKLYAVLLFVVCGILIGVTHLNSVQINDIQVDTDSYIKPEMIQDLTLVIIQRPVLGVIRRDNIVLLPRSEIRHEIKSMSSRIKAVDINITAVQSLEITAANREAVVSVCQNQQSTSSTCLSVDENGFMFPSNGTSKDELLQYTTTKPPRPGIQLLSPHRFQALQSFIDALREMDIDTMQVDLNPADDVTLHTVSSADDEVAGEVEIRINLYQELPQVASNLQSSINSDSFIAAERDETGVEVPVSPFSLEYIDLRFENKIFYR